MVAKKATKKVYVFFNCDEEKSRASMNIFYNNEVFKDTKVSRKSLWEKVLAEMEAGRLQIEQANVQKAQEAVLNGDPCEASQYLRYGKIDALICH